MATLMGSDVSKGIKGIGPVKAREAVQAFHGDGSTRAGMRAFFESSYACSESQRRDFLVAYDEYTAPAKLSHGHTREKFVWRAVDIDK